jgi:outer membrane receptor protein involved in Fe transport
MFTKTIRFGRSRLSAAVAVAVGSGAASALPHAAQAQQSAQDLEEIVVTGSRIQRRDFTSNSPIVTVEQESFEAQAGLNFEAYLNQLPNYNPAAAPTTTQFDVQITPVNSVGIASISLRGFGPNRNLVLVDGKRPTPINALMVTDINAIPSALVERVETITGGASAVYGADAVGGVTNFILRDDFEGIEVDAQFGSLADGGGNIALGIERYDRDSVLERDRDWYQDRYRDPFAPGSFTFLQGTTHYNCLFNCPGDAAVEGVLGAPVTSVFNPFSANVFRQFVFNADETLFVENSAAGLANFTGGPNFTFFPSRVLDESVPGQYERHRRLEMAQPARAGQRAAGAVFVLRVGHVRLHGERHVLLARAARGERDAHGPVRHERDLRLGGPRALRPGHGQPAEPRA